MAVRGIGVDLCSVKRMGDALRNEAFAKRVFTEQEIAYACSQTVPARHFASAFAAREALAKAGGWGVGLMGLKSCRVERTKRGPRLAFSEEFAARLAAEDITSTHLSITHEGDAVVAIVVLEGENRACRGSGTEAPPFYDEKMNVSYYYSDNLPALLRPVPRDTHKGEKGGVLIVGGSQSYRGAPVLAALGALRAGAGYVVLAIPDFMVDAAAVSVPEAVFAPLATEDGAIKEASVREVLRQWDKKCGSVVFGPGTGRDESLRSVTGLIWNEWEKPLLLDADALFFFSSLRHGLRSRDNAVITPHSGEAGTILGLTAEEVNSQRLMSAQKLTDKAGVAVLKGMDTVVARNGENRIIKEGSPALSVPGSGDVLSGAIGAFLASGPAPFDAATAGALLHAIAGSRLEAKKGTRGILAREIADELPFAFG